MSCIISSVPAAWSVTVTHCHLHSSLSTLYVLIAPKDSWPTSHDNDGAMCGGVGVVCVSEIALWDRHVVCCGVWCVGPTIACV